jgi:tRNA (cytidine56-2'-O)-methyltransferase
LPKTFVLKIGHRPERDKRISMHCALVARAFGADGIFFDYKDIELEARVESVVKRFGGPFSVETGVDWKKKLETWREIGAIIHLTMYGIPVQDAMTEIAGSQSDKLIVVGGPKVPAILYNTADYNVSVTQQPHSEVASICIFLDRYFRGAELNREFSKAEIKIVPQRVGKLVVKDS